MDARPVSVTDLLLAQRPAQQMGGIREVSKLIPPLVRDINNFPEALKNR
jgi:hypothetical protein